MPIKHFTAISTISLVAIFLLLIMMVVNIKPGHDLMSFAQHNSSSSLPFPPQEYRNNILNHANNSSGILTIVTISNDGSLLDGATYSITKKGPGVAEEQERYNLKDNSVNDTNKSTTGIITIIGLRNGNYTITEEEAPQGYVKDKLSKLIEITQDQKVATAIFTNIPSKLMEQNSNKSLIKGITYNAKFECGSIFGNEGPLRPGHYDTDISIFNRQDYPVKILWNAVINEGMSTNAIVKLIQPQSSVGLSCKDLHQLLNIKGSNDQLIEGFVIISPQLNTDILGSALSNEGGTAIQSSLTQGDQLNFLDVQVFYTANALTTLPQEMLIEKITFSIMNDTSTKIPRSLLMKTLDIAIQTNLNEIANTESDVKTFLAKKYNLSDKDLEDLKIRIINISLQASSMADDHAISLFRVNPQATN
jgi:Prealbumin-like fold domain